MSLFYSVLTALALAAHPAAKQSSDSPQFAPADVPKNHWAFGAVNDLFANGLLKGYPPGSVPGKPLVLIDIPVDMEKARQRQARWDKEKLLSYYETSLPLIGGRGRREPSHWELAVATHAIHAQLYRGYETKDRPTRQVIQAELPELADSISMFQYELKQLGADPRQMIADLEYIRQYGVPKLAIDESRSYRRESVLALLKPWRDKNLLGPHYSAFRNVRGGFTLEESTQYEQTILVYSAWLAMCDDMPKAQDELHNLARAISMTRKEITRLGGDPEEMIQRLNRLQIQPTIRFRG